MLEAGADLRTIQVLQGWDTDMLCDIDHRLVVAPYLRLAEQKANDHGGVTCVFDFRMAQPNQETILPAVLHSFEHFFLVQMRKSLEGFVLVAPMGCQTGLYLVIAREISLDELMSASAVVLRHMIESHSVPLSTVETCGQAALHDLAGAKAVAQKLLNNIDKFRTVMS